MKEIKGKYNTAKVFTDNIEEEAVVQILELCNQEWVEGNTIRIMPDVHAGKGCVIGLSMTITDKICPNLIGVDIGCGMLCYPLGKVDIDLAVLDKFINTFIPNGFEVNDSPDYLALELIDLLYCKPYLRDLDRLASSWGTLGGGNHFIEIDEDDDGCKYLVIHTGSRNLGHQVAKYYQELAYQEMLAEVSNYEERSSAIINSLKLEGRQAEISGELQKLKKERDSIAVSKDLCYLKGKSAKEYLSDMYLCQIFARNNRNIIAEKIITHLQCEQGLDTGDQDAFETIHNYISEVPCILRKGAISALEGKKVLIPINMRDGCIIGVGKGNIDYNYTAPHGAGRIMSRNEARKTISVQSFEDSMKGIYSSSVCINTLDESSMAYKPMQEIIDNIKETVDIQKIIKPIYNFKAS